MEEISMRKVGHKPPIQFFYSTFLLSFFAFAPSLFPCLGLSFSVVSSGYCERQGSGSSMQLNHVPRQTGAFIYG